MTDGWRRILYGLVAVLALIGVVAIGSFGLQLREDYQNFRKIVVWVAQKQALEQQQLQRQQQQRQQAPVPVPTTSAPVDAPAPAGK